MQPDVPFVPHFHNVDVDALNLETMSIDQFDKCLRRLSNEAFRVPTLVRVYLKNGCSFVGFNVDPDFNYCIDALVLVDLDREQQSEGQ